MNAILRCFFGDNGFAAARSRAARRRWAAMLLAGGLAVPAQAQNRTGDNAVTQAEDAFGYSVGRESLGIYSANNARGFSPTSAGNLRLDGLYFAPVTSLSSLLVDSQSIKVGLSAQGYPFVAPSGIVDQRLRTPGDKAGASLLLNGDSFGSVGVELDASVPLASALSLGLGLNAGHTAFADGTNNHFHAEALAARWHPLAGVEVIPFWSLYNDYDDEASAFYIPAGNFLPRLPRPAHYGGPWWDNIRYTATNHGVLTSAALSRGWRLRVGLFRSVVDQISAYTHLLTDIQPDGTGHRIVLADPPHTSRSLSGEARLTRVITDGPRLHTIHLSLSGRDTARLFGGSDPIDLGASTIDATVRTPRPPLTFGPQSRDRVHQTTYGIAYDGRWRSVGELSFGLSRTFYRKSTRIPGETDLLSRASPWLYNITAAIFPNRRLALYAGYAHGLEESGTPPPNAANRNQALPAILTRQIDGGVRVALTDRLKAVAGLFDLRRPDFGFDSANRYVQTGSIRSRGAEFSLAGDLTRRLDVVAGGVFLDATTEAQPNAAGVLGKRPVGIPAHILSLSANWKSTFLAGLSLDASVSQTGATPATTDDAVEIPPRAVLNLGARYSFRIGKTKATARLQVANLFDQRGFSSAGPGAYSPNAGRAVTGYVAVDL